MNARAPAGTAPSRTTLSDVRDSVVQAIRECAIFESPRDGIPLPQDRDAEERLTVALLAGDVEPAALAPLRSEDYCSELHAAVYAFRLGSRATSTLAIGNALEREGYVITGWDVTQYLDHLLEQHRIRDRNPRTIAAYRDRVLERARARALSAMCRRIDSLLRLDEMTYQQALAELGIPPRPTKP